MKIEIWSDFICPFCYLGTKRMTKALEQLDFDVEVKYRSYELNPYEQEKSSVIDSLMQKYNKSHREIVEMLMRTSEAFKSENLVYNYEQALNVNTNLAHQFAKLSILKNKAQEASDLLFLAHFTEGKDIADINVILEIANKVGLDLEEVRVSLAENKFLNDVELDRYDARQFGISSVPRFIVNDKFAIVGAQSTEYFIEALQNINQQEQLLLKQNNLSCNDESCEN